MELLTNKITAFLPTASCVVTSNANGMDYSRIGRRNTEKENAKHTSKIKFTNMKNPRDTHTEREKKRIK